MFRVFTITQVMSLRFYITMTGPATMFTFDDHVPHTFVAFMEAL